MPRERGSFDASGLRQGSLTIFLASYLLAVSSSALAAGLEPGSLGWWSVILSPLGIGLVWIFGPWLGRLWPWRSIEPVPRIFRPEPCRGLVVFVSPGKGSATAAHAIDYHGTELAYIWLVHSDRSRADAEHLSEEAARRPNLATEGIRRLYLPDRRFDDPELVRNLLEREVFGRLPEDLEPGDVLIDFTGGLKGTSAGALLTGLPPERRLQYTPAALTDTRGRGTRPGDPVEIGIDYKLKRARRRAR